MDRVIINSIQVPPLSISRRSTISQRSLICMKTSSSSSTQQHPTVKTIITMETFTMEAVLLRTLLTR